MRKIHFIVVSDCVSHEEARSKVHVILDNYENTFPDNEWFYNVVLASMNESGDTEWVVPSDEYEYGFSMNRESIRSFLAKEITYNLYVPNGEDVAGVMNGYNMKNSFFVYQYFKFLHVTKNLKSLSIWDDTVGGGELSDCGLSQHLSEVEDNKYIVAVSVET